MGTTAGDIVNFISKAAPFIGSLFGPAGTAIGTLAGTGLGLAAKALGCDETPDAVAQAIATDPNAAMKLRQYEMDNKLEILKLHVAEYGMEVAEKDSARKREVEMAKISGKSDKFIYGLAIWCLIAPIAIILLLMWKGLPSMSTPVTLLVGSLIGIIVGEYKTITGYFFGTNRSSEVKTAMLFNSTPIK